MVLTDVSKVLAEDIAQATGEIKHLVSAIINQLVVTGGIVPMQLKRFPSCPQRRLWSGKMFLQALKHQCVYFTRNSFGCLGSLWNLF